MIHTGETRHECKTCGAKFIAKSTLDRHSMVHTGERPFECALCQKKFGTCSHIRRHFKAVHKDSKEISYKKNGQLVNINKM